jgi:hypothetical protein
MIYNLPDGSTLEVPDGTLIDGHPDMLARKRAPESTRSHQYVPIRSFHHPETPQHDPHSMGPKPQAPTSGYGNGDAECEGYDL